MDGTVTLDVRLVLKTDDDSPIAMTFRCARHGPPDIVARIEWTEVVDPASHYFRANPFFETAAPKYDWINRVVAIGIRCRQVEGVTYSIFEALWNAVLRTCVHPPVLTNRTVPLTGNGIGITNHQQRENC